MIGALALEAPASVIGRERRAIYRLHQIFLRGIRVLAITRVTWGSDEFDPPWWIFLADLVRGGLAWPDTVPGGPSRSYSTRWIHRVRSAEW